MEINWREREKIESAERGNRGKQKEREREREREREKERRGRRGTQH